MSTTAGDSSTEQNVPALGLRHVLLVYTSPRSLFSRVEDTGAYGWALVTLLVVIMLLGYAEVQTGLIDADVERQTERARAELEEAQGDLVDRVQLRESLEGISETGEFSKLMTRLGVIVFSPVYMLASFLLIASVLYAVVALTGRKPEWHTLISICVYAGFIELAAHALRLAMVLTYRTTAVDTSLAPLGAPGEPTVWAAVDPFRIWFWVLVIMGLAVTRQLSRRMAVVSCSLMFLAALGVRIGLQYAVR